MIARENPFCVSKVLQVRFEPQGTSWQKLLRRLNELSYRASVVGPEGSGKTTLLEDLASYLKSRFPIRWFSLSEDDPIPSLREIHSDDLVFIDGADLLGFFDFQKLFWKKSAGLIITSHHSTPLPTLLKCSTSPELLIRIQQKLIGDETSTALCHQLFGRHQGNLRDALRELYDIWAEKEGSAGGRERRL